MKIKNVFGALMTATAIVSACNSPKQEDTSGSKKYRLITLAPGHFHAALIQKSMYPEVDSTVHVYAPEGSELDAYNALISQYNSREENPTSWNQVVYSGNDFLQKMLEEKKGDILVLAGNNRDKTGYILQAVEAGLHVLADKPMAIDYNSFLELEKAFDKAAEKNVLLYDIMTERYEVNTMLQMALAHSPEFFGGMVTGSAEEPAITKESVHYFFKQVSGKPLVRPAWFFDVAQQGEGIVDVTTHLVDMVQWESFPEEVIDYKKDISFVSARRWPTVLTPQQFQQVTKLSEVPEYLKKDLNEKGELSVYSNGEMIYTLKGIHAKISVVWNFEAPAGTGDTHYSIMRGNKANLIIKQGAEENYKPVLYAERTGDTDEAAFEESLTKALQQLGSEFAGLSFTKNQSGLYKINIDPSLVTNHEQHFSQVTEKYLSFLKEGKLPDWEVPNMLAKYYTTTKALELAKSAQ